MIRGWKMELVKKFGQQSGKSETFRFENEREI